MNGAAAQTVAGTQIMGVLNVTPDSFFEPSRTRTADSVRDTAEAMLVWGAHILDIGGESSRPGSKPIGLEEELSRVVPALESIAHLNARISIDTYRAETARRALELGAFMVNDITAFRGDPEMVGIVAAARAECVLMHMQGTPETMQQSPVYEDVMDTLQAFFEERIALCLDAGIPQDRIWIDPGFGFGKTVPHNLTILNRLEELTRLGCRILVGTSNKSTIGAVLNSDVDDRLEGTAATVAISIQNGADAVRVHDVRAMARVARMTDAILGRIHFE